MAAQYKTIHPVKYYRDYLNHDIRPDGRELLKMRPIAINVNSIDTADGSSIVKIGNTTIVCGIKAELSAPKASEQENGFIVPNIELTPLCSSKFRPGPPTEEAQVYSRCLADIINNSECLDLKQLCIEKEKLVWVLYCDLSCFDHDGCILDASIIAIISALKTLKLPRVNYDPDTNIYKVEEDVRTSIEIKSIPVSTSFIVFDDNVIIADPTTEEESLSSSSVTVVVSDSELCFMNKPGGSPLTPQQLDVCLNVAKQREKTVCALLDSVLKK